MRKCRKGNKIETAYSLQRFNYNYMEYDVREWKYKIKKTRFKGMELGALKTIKLRFEVYNNILK